MQSLFLFIGVVFAKHQIADQSRDDAACQNHRRNRKEAVRIRQGCLLYTSQFLAVMVGMADSAMVSSAGQAAMSGAVSYTHLFAHGLFGDAR